MSSHTSLPAGRVTHVVVATSIMLTFISFWRAAAIVLNDLGSSAFYVGGIAEHAIGRAAPWFILGVMLFSYAVRAVYVESCAMFTRGGVYRVVKEAMGGTLAKLSVSMISIASVRVVGTPSSSNSDSALRARAMAAGRSSAQTITLATSES